MKDEKHIRVPIRHTSPHKSAALFFSSSPANSTSQCTWWPNMHNIEKDKKVGQRDSRQTGRQCEWACERPPPPPFLWGLWSPLKLWGSDDLYQGLDYHLSKRCHGVAGRSLT